MQKPEKQTEWENEAGEKESSKNKEALLWTLWSSVKMKGQDDV